MANLNLVQLIGRLTRDPESRTFANGGKVVSFGFAVNERKKVGDQWTDSPVFLDIKAFNAGEHGRKLADLCEQYLSKGSPAYLQGKLTVETWEAKDGGGKRSKMVIILSDVQFLTPKGGDRPGRAEPASERSEESQEWNTEPPATRPPSQPVPEEDIPF